MNAQTVLDFWWQELTPQQWFARDAAVDQQIAERFTDLHRRAAQGELADWRVDMPGRLAEIIVLDHGKVVQRGQHEELYAQAGLYHDLVTMS